MKEMELSISIFRRLSLFPGLIRRGLGRVLKDFQSPFSGDFLCFKVKEVPLPEMKCSFNLHFQETFFVSELVAEQLSVLDSFLSISIFRRLSLFPTTTTEFTFARTVFQSPFSGDFLCFSSDLDEETLEVISFQSPFSGDFLCFRLLYSSSMLASFIFQSPFSGDFLCFSNICRKRDLL